MRIAYILNIATAAFLLCSRLIVTVYEVAAEICMTPFRADYGLARLIAEPFSLMAHKVIQLLKPEYRESYETHGLNMPATAARLF